MIVETIVIGASEHRDFNQRLFTKIKEMQSKGFVVEVQYQMSINDMEVAYGALLIGRVSNET